MMKASSSPPAYDRVCLIGRVPALPVHTARRLYEAADTFAAVREVVHADCAIRAAIRVASPALFPSLLVWLDGGVPKNKRTRVSVLSYVLRMATRCTPFGLFSSVGTFTVGERTTLAVSGEQAQRMSVRPDAGWVRAALRDRQADPHGIWAASVVTNDLVIERGDLLYVMDDARATRVDAGGPTPIWRYDAVHLRQNEAVRWLRTAARTPLRVDELVGRTAERFRSTAEIAFRLIKKLLDAAVLNFVRPSLLDPALPALARLAGSDDTRTEFVEIEAAVAAFSAAGPGAVTPERVTDLERRLQSAAHVDGAAFGIDAAHDFAGDLGTNVLDDAALLAKVMLNDGTSVSADAALRTFIDRYESLDRLIPLLELVHDDFVAETLTPAPPSQPQRESLLASLAAQALRDRAAEIAIDDRTFDRICPGVRAARLAQTCEIGFVVCAADRAAIDAGAYRIVPTAGANSDGIGKSAGRFIPLLDAAFGAEIRRARDAHGEADEIVAELDYHPVDARSGNLIARPSTARFVIADAAIRHADNVVRISPADIVVGIVDGRFAAYDRTSGKRIRIQESYVLETAYFAPPHMRFLAQIGQAERRTPRPFDWGRAACALPYLPRLRYGRVVLAPARWIVPRNELAGDSEQIERTISNWRGGWHLPRWVYLTARDVKLLLDLDSAAARDLLRDALPKYRGDTVLFEEMLPGFDDLWLERNGERVAHEFVAGFHVDGPPAPRLRMSRRVADEAPVVHGPGSGWVYCKLYAPQTELHALLGDVVPAVIQAAGEAVDRWFYLRYRDPAHHLRLRMRAADGRGAALRERVIQTLEPILSSGRIARYTFDTYRTEADRFGGNDALDPIEQLFHADSGRVLAALGSRLALETPTACALRTFTPFLRAWFTHFDLRAWLAASTERVRDGSAIDYALVRAVRGWLEVPDDDVTLAENAAIEAIANLERDGRLAQPSGYVLGALMHVHFNRAGIDFSDEPRLEAHLRRALRALEATRPASALSAT